MDGLKHLNNIEPNSCYELERMLFRLKIRHALWDCGYLNGFAMIYCKHLAWMRWLWSPAWVPCSGQIGLPHIAWWTSCEPIDLKCSTGNNPLGLGHTNQGSTYPIDHWSGQVKPCLANGFEQSFILYSIQVDRENAQFWNLGKYKILDMSSLQTQGTQNLVSQWL